LDYKHVSRTDYARNPRFYFIDTVKVETAVSVHNEEDVIGVETDGVRVPQECEPEVSHVLR
jgi:hypothetical protein